MKSLVAIVGLALGFTAGCDSSGPTVDASGEGKQIAVPTFSIAIRLDKAAEDKLRGARETIKGAVYFDGDGTPLPGVKTAPHRDVFLGTHEFEIDKPGTIRIEGATISGQAHSRLSDENYHFTINVFSGRRSFKNNVLDGGIAHGRLRDLVGEKTVQIHCKLL